MPGAEIGAIYSFRVPDGRYGALQVLAEGQYGKIEVAPLAGLWPAPAAVAEVTKAKLLRNRIGGRTSRCNVDPEVPWWAVLVTIAAPKETPDEPCATFGASWQTAFGAYWDERRTARDAAPRWAVFDGAKGTRDNVHYAGDDPRFVDFMVAQCVSEATWTTHGQKRIDLSKTSLDELTIEVGDEPLVLVLPRALRELHLAGKIENIRVVREEPIFPFCLRIETPELPNKAVAGLEQVELIEAWELRVADVSKLTGYPSLRQLLLQGKAVSIRSAESFAKIPSLVDLTIRFGFDLDGNAFPKAWEALRRIEIKGLRKSALPVLKKKLAGVAAVSISGAKTDAWIAENLGNPFRGWEDDDARFGKAACAAWKKASAAATELGKTTEKRAEPVLRALVDALNALDTKFDIDTLRREEAGEAFFALARDLGVPEKRAGAWFDAWREF